MMDMFISVVIAVVVWTIQGHFTAAQGKMKTDDDTVCKSSFSSEITINVGFVNERKVAGFLLIETLFHTCDKR